MRLRLAPLALLMVAAAISPGVARADNIDLEVAAVAKQVKQYLAGQAAPAVAVGPIKCTADESVSHGPGLGLRLRNHLADAGVKVDPDAPLGLAGEYRDKTDPRTRRVVVELTLWVAKRNSPNEHLVRFTRAIHGVDALIDLVAPAAVALPPGAEDDQQEARLVERIDQLRSAPTKAPPPVDGTRAFADDSKTYGVEVAVKTPNGFEPRKPTPTADGDLLVELKKDDVFAVRLVNNSPTEVGATVLIDGLDAFSFGAYEKVSPKPRWLVPAGKTAAVQGWPVGPNRMDEFKVTEYAQGAVAAVGGDRAKVGVLTVKFASAWPKGSPPPPDEIDARKSRGDLAVGRGATVEAPLNRVEREFGRTRAAVTVRYSRD